jgi:hypothetical protein
MSPSPVQVRAALETLGAAGFSLSAPASERLRLLSPAQVAELCAVHIETARSIVKSLPGSVMLPGGDLRARVVELEAWMDARPATAAPFREKSPKAA